MTSAAATVAVFDVGKTNVKLSAVTAEGHVIETLSAANIARAGPPWQHHDLEGLAGWLLPELAGLCRRHPIAHVITVGHGSGGVLVTDDPDGPGGGAALPMIDYEQPLPEEIAAAYAPLSGTFLDRGSAIMQGAAHQARHLFWMQRAEPATFAKGRWYLGLPQYWAWRLSGIAASEFSYLGAQSHLWNVAEKRFTPIVQTQGWLHLMPPFAHAGADLGTIRKELALRHGLPEDLTVHTGAHDSTTNFYRYQAAGLDDSIVVSTGTWIVALAGTVPVEMLDEWRNMTLNSDMEGRPLGGALVMGGREFSHVAGPQDGNALADLALVRKLVSHQTFPLPSFGADGGQFPGSAGRGRIAGPQPASPGERLALAVLYMALLTVTCADTLGPHRDMVLDGSYLRDPVYVRLVATLRNGARTSCSNEHYGIAAGAALLCTCERRRAPASLDLVGVPPLNNGDPLIAYANRWRQLARQNLN